ncbi:hypothetical protein [Pedobacter nyackensis]|uniref:hypothetical protein n=1 Tax=Pedobacter nyackensis TaxID=475255 RepID=UPI00292F8B9A|nr:hypothetical protein [Pedobacter nyackensis]
MSDHIVFSIGLFFLFFFIYLVKNIGKWKANNGERLDRFPKQVAASNKMQLSVTDHFQDKTLGFDTQKNKMLFIDLGNNIIQIVDMNDVGECKLIKKRLSIQLEVNYEDHGKHPLTITFYNKFRDYKWMRSKLEQKASYWESFMNKILDEKYETTKYSGAKDFE